MQILSITHFRKEIAGKMLFAIDHLTVSKGDRIGVIGNNGSGKTTLLHAIQEKDPACHYEISVSSLPQLQQPDHQSGGEQQKQSLLQLLKNPSDLLLLDEPSSHLDVKNQQWLIKQLKKFPGSLMIVSHDRAFLDQLANKIWAFSQGKVQAYAGNYSQYQRQYQTSQARQLRSYQSNEKIKSRLQTQIAKRTQAAYRVKKGNRKKLSQSDKKAISITSHDHMEKKLQSGAKAIEKRLARLPRIDKPRHESSLRFVDLLTEKKRGQTLLHIQDAALIRRQRLLISKINLKLSFGDHLVISGPNGSGKTSLLQMILVADNDKIWLNPEAEIGYFAQDLPIQDPEKTVFASLRQQSQQTNQVIYHLLGSLGFDQRLSNQANKFLSGGERVKANLAKILLGRYNLLLLDEVTNFLDVRAMDALQGFINSYPGTVILVSHDQRFVEQIKGCHLRISDKNLI